MGADLELIARSLVHMRRTQHVETLDLGRQRNRALDHSTSTLGRIDDLQGRLVDQAVIERLQANANFLTLHILLLHLRGIAAGLKNENAWPQPAEGATC